MEIEEDRYIQSIHSDTYIKNLCEYFMVNDYESLKVFLRKEKLYKYDNTDLDKILIGKGNSVGAILSYKKILANSGIKNLSLVISSQMAIEKCEVLSLMDLGIEYIVTSEHIPCINKNYANYVIKELD